LDLNSSLRIKKFVLKPKDAFRVPVDAEAISPSRFEGMDKKAVEALEVWEGNRRTNLGSLFDISESEVELKDEEMAKEDGPFIEILGDLSKVRRLGRAMAKGIIHVKGSGGLRLGEAMRGGRILVEGNVGPWLGSRMRGGKIEVFGNAGDKVGSPLPGGNEGMRGGTIVIHGDAGDEVGSFMMGGLIVVDGSVGQFVGYGMKGGDILVRGGASGRAGASMKGGRIIVLGHCGAILPSFSIQEIRTTIRIGEERMKGPFYFFQGDLNEGGKGRLFVSKEANPQLLAFERYLEGLEDF
jgi:formylmethanofuran dehydrogenase subunit C